MVKHIKKERKGRFIQIEHWIIKTEAWQSLSPQEVRVFLLLLERYYGSNNGRIGLSIRDAARKGNMAQNTASKALRTLIEKGFVIKRYTGSFSQKLPRASEYELTHVRCGENMPSKEFAKWKPEKKTVLKSMQDALILDAVGEYAEL